MTGLVRKAALLVAGGMLIAGAGMAGVPSPLTSTIPTCINIVDGSGVTVAANCMTIRDALSNPVAFATVVLDFNACSPDAGVEECDNQPDPTTGTPGVTEGPGEILTYTTDASGALCVNVVGTGTNVTPVSGGRPVCCSIYAGSNLMATVVVTVSSYDLGSVGGLGVPDAVVNGLDGAFWVADFTAFVGGTYNSRSDYNCDGAIGGVDGAFWVNAFFNWLPGLPCTLLP